MTAPELQQEIERTRGQLGRIVDELAAKADLKARAKDKAAEVRDKARGKAVETQHKARGKAVQAQHKAAELSGRVRQSQVVQRRWPPAVAAGVLVIGIVTAAVIVRRRNA